ncbi:MAG TPA: MarR family transcriptional regulator [Candidatus Anaerotignum merdipullorum]|nr:MarR family transcriptional regulator [Candidatus Anaerotignum merdipullorum]
MELTQCINYLLTTAQHSVFQYLSGKLSEYDVTPSQYGVLSCLWQREFATPKQISEILCLETSTISGVLDRMQKKGLIDRVINRDDRREVRVVPTEKGKALQEPISQIIDEVNESVLRCFTEEEVTMLKNQLRVIAEGNYS